jgi:type II secretory pathway pseudopilin PulG
VLRRIRRVPGPSDGGETLVEVLAALVLFALLVGTLVSGIASVIAVGNFRQQQAAVGAAIRTISEQLNASHGGANSTACTNTVASIIVNQLNAFNTTNAAALPTGVGVFVSTKPTLPTVVGGSFSGGVLNYPSSNDCSGSTPPALSSTLGTIQVNFYVAAAGVDAIGNSVLAQQDSGGNVSGKYVRQVTLVLGSPRV